MVRGCIILYVYERPSKAGYQVSLMQRSLILAGSFLLVPIMVQAQGRGGAGFSAGGHAVAAAPRSVSVAHAAPAGVARVSGGTRIAPRSASGRVSSANPSVRVIRRPNTVRPRTPGNRQLGFDSGGAPGLGFDSFHFAVTHPNRGNRFDRDRRRNRNDFAAFFPFFDGGFFLPSSPLDAEDGYGEGPQEEAYAEDAPQGPQYPQYRGPEPPTASPQVIAEPQRPSEEYVFVRRDGTVFFAVAYAWDSGTLRYVTTEGLRRSVGREALDLDATQKFNEQRGLNFHSPA
jgi:hypothetical protein